MLQFMINFPNQFQFSSNKAGFEHKNTTIINSLQFKIRTDSRKNCDLTRECTLFLPDYWRISGAQVIFSGARSLTFLVSICHLIFSKVACMYICILSYMTSCICIVMYNTCTMQVLQVNYPISTRPDTHTHVLYRRVIGFI